MRHPSGKNPSEGASDVLPIIRTIIFPFILGWFRLREESQCSINARNSKDPVSSSHGHNKLWSRIQVCLSTVESFFSSFFNLLHCSFNKHFNDDNFGNFRLSSLVLRQRSSQRNPSVRRRTQGEVLGEGELQAEGARGFLHQQSSGMEEQSSQVWENSRRQGYFSSNQGKRKEPGEFNCSSI